MPRLILVENEGDADVVVLASPSYSYNFSILDKLYKKRLMGIVKSRGRSPGLCILEVYGCCSPSMFNTAVAIARLYISVAMDTGREAREAVRVYLDGVGTSKKGYASYVRKLLREWLSDAFIPVEKSEYEWFKKKLSSLPSKEVNVSVNEYWFKDRLYRIEHILFRSRKLGTVFFIEKRLPREFGEAAEERVFLVKPSIEPRQILVSYILDVDKDYYELLPYPCNELYKKLCMRDKKTV